MKLIAALLAASGASASSGAIKTGRQRRLALLGLSRHFHTYDVGVSEMALCGLIHLTHTVPIMFSSNNPFSLH